MDPTRWGPKLWFIMHTLSFNYPDNPTDIDKMRIKTFFDSLKFVIPCEACRQHYNQHTTKNPIDNYLNSKEKLVEWVVNLHNTVSESIGKPTWSIEQVKEHYKNIFNEKCNISNSQCSKPKESNKKNIYYIIITILVLILLLILYLIKKQHLTCLL